MASSNIFGWLIGSVDTLGVINNEIAGINNSNRFVEICIENLDITRESYFPRAKFPHSDR